VQEIKNFYYGAKTDLASLPGDEEAFLKLTGPPVQMPRFRIRVSFSAAPDMATDTMRIRIEAPFVTKKISLGSGECV
jgi:hypothetical protein